MYVLQVRGLTMVPVSSEEEALRQFFLGEQARSTAQHALNTNSSRSHALFTLHIEMRASAEAEERALLSKLHLVDLAGEQMLCPAPAAQHKTTRYFAYMLGCAGGVLAYQHQWLCNPRQ